MKVETHRLPIWASVLQHTPQAIRVFDRFHVAGHLGRAVDTVRREHWRKTRGPQRSVLKGTRFLLPSNPWNLREEEKLRLQELVSLNLPIVRAYLLKEDFQRFWDYRQPAAAQRHLTRWLGWASRSRLHPFVELARRIRRYLDGILAWTKWRITNGALEGMNNKVKMISHRSFAFRNVENYKAAIYHCCASLALP